MEALLRWAIAFVGPVLVVLWSASAPGHTLTGTTTATTTMRRVAPDPAPAEAPEDAPKGVRFRFKPGKGLLAESHDGQFSLATRVRGQFRYALEDSASGLLHQFRIRRARIVFSGHLFGSKNRYKMELAVSPNDLGIGNDLAEDLEDRVPTNSPLLDLYMDFRQLRDLSVRIGQYKLPSNRTRVISSGNLQMVDRSIVNSEFTLDRDMGLDLRSADFLGLDLLRYYAGVSIGRGRDSQGFDDFGLNYFVRLEVLPFGMFKDYSEVDFKRTDRARLSIGAVYVYQDRNRGLRRITSRLPEDGGTTDYQMVMVDAIFKHSGFTAQVEAALRHGERNADGDTSQGALTPARNGWGAMLQAGYLVQDVPFEVSARVGAVRSIGEADKTSLSDTHEVGVGMGWYFFEHPFKLQIDAFRLWQSRFAEGDTRVRVQLQPSL